MDDTMSKWATVNQRTFGDQVISDDYSSSTGLKALIQTAVCRQYVVDAQAMFTDHCKPLLDVVWTRDAGIDVDSTEMAVGRVLRPLNTGKLCTRVTWQYYRVTHQRFSSTIQRGVCKNVYLFVYFLLFTVSITGYYLSTVWVKKSPWCISTFFHKRLRIFSQCFTHLLYVPIR